MDISNQEWNGTLHIDADIARAWTLPAHLYLDASNLLSEAQKIFFRTWQVAGHASRVANPGDFFTIELMGEPLLFVRGLDGVLRGFYNVCRHRAGPPAEGCGSRKLFRCGYHGWTYALDGTLLSATEIEGVEDFHPEEFALKPVRTEEWFNFVNKVTEEVVKDYPGFVITTNGYTNRTTPPEGVKLHPNMGVMFAAIWADMTEEGTYPGCRFEYVTRPPLETVRRGGLVLRPQRGQSRLAALPDRAAFDGGFPCRPARPFCSSGCCARTSRRPTAAGPGRPSW